MDKVSFMFACFCWALVSLSLCGGAVWLIANGYEHGWGWLLTVGLLVACGGSISYRSDDCKCKADTAGEEQ